MKQIVAYIALIALTGCAYLTSTSGQKTVQTLIGDGGLALCKSLPPADQYIATMVVSGIEGGTTSMADAFANPSAQFVSFFGPAWALLNGVLVAVAPAQYGALLVTSEKALVDGCAKALGVTVVSVPAPVPTPSGPVTALFFPHVSTSASAG